MSLLFVLRCTHLCWFSCRALGLAHSCRAQWCCEVRAAEQLREMAHGKNRRMRSPTMANRTQEGRMMKRHAESKNCFHFLLFFSTTRHSRDIASIIECICHVSHLFDRVKRQYAVGEGSIERQKV